MGCRQSYFHNSAKYYGNSVIVHRIPREVLSEVTRRLRLLFSKTVLADQVAAMMEHNLEYQYYLQDYYCDAKGSVISENHHLRFTISIPELKPIVFKLNFPDNTTSVTVSFVVIPAVPYVKARGFRNHYTGTEQSAEDFASHLIQYQAVLKNPQNFQDKLDTLLL